MLDRIWRTAVEEHGFQPCVKENKQERGFSPSI